MSDPSDAGSAAATGATPRAIEHHYDVGREFYRLWLDTEMVYSCALWDEPLTDDPVDDALESAQQAKLAWHATAADADDASRVLDVGCGWGANLRYLTGARGVAHATGLTLSSDQAAAVTPSESIAVRLEDWRDHRPSEPYDAIISIGAFEHFARQDLDDAARQQVYAHFFAMSAGWLKPGGRLSLQSIAYEDFDPSSGPVSSFFTEDIFPESSLPRLGQIITAAEPFFRLVAYRSDATHYERTLHVWQRRLEAHSEAAIALVGRSTYRRYVRYLRVSRAMFDRRVCTLYRLAFERRPTAPKAETPPPEHPSKEP